MLHALYRDGDWRIICSEGSTAALCGKRGSYEPVPAPTVITEPAPARAA